MKIDNEADRFSSALLSEVARLNPHLSKQLTKRVERIAAIKNDKKLRKAAKVAILVKEHLGLYEEAAKRLRGTWSFSHQRLIPKSLYSMKISISYFRMSLFLGLSSQNIVMSKRGDLLEEQPNKANSFATLGFDNGLQH